MTRYKVEHESGVQDFATPEELGAALAKKSLGDVSTFAVEDDGEERTLTESEQERFDNAFDDHLADRQSDEDADRQANEFYERRGDAS